MVEETYTMTVSGTGRTTKQVTVPADAQREKGIAIDDEVEVEIHGVSDIIDKASFTATQTGGDRVTVPASVVQQLGLVAGDKYEFNFSRVEEDELPGGIADEDVTDNEDVADAIEEAESETNNEDSSGLGELFSTEESEEDEAEAEVEDEQEEEGLGELFG